MKENGKLTHGNNIGSDASALIDILRGLAVTGVVFVHTSQIGSQILNKNRAVGAPIWFSELFSFGMYGVQLFFAISGFLIFTLYEKGFERKSYFLRRFSRIYPLWVMFLLLGILQSRLLDSSLWHSKDQAGINDASNPTFPFLTLFLALTFTLFLDADLWNSVIPGGWSIQAEVIHYLTFPFLQKYDNRKKLLFLSVMILMFQVFTFVLGHTTSESNYINALFARLNLGSTFFFFMMGLVVLLIKNNEFKFRVNSLNFNLMLLFFLTTSTFAVLISTANFGTNAEATIFVLFMYFLGKVIHRNSHATKLFRSLGKYSYFIYFAHFQVLWVLNSISKHTSAFSSLNTVDSQLIASFCLISFAVLTLMVCTVAGKVSMQNLESPVQRYFRKFED